MHKNRIREEVLCLRNQLDLDEVYKMSEIIKMRLHMLESYKNTEWVFAYMSFKNEVDTHGMITAAIRSGKRVAVPKVTGAHLMSFYEIKALSDTKTGTMGILEPVSENKIIPGLTIPQEEILMIVPGLAFDQYGHRTGWGGGFYDTYISKYPKITTVGVAYAFQLYEQLETQPHDQCVDYVLTELEIIDTKRRNCDGRDIS